MTAAVTHFPLKIVEARHSADHSGSHGVVLPGAPEHAHKQARLLDSHGRTIRDLRLSITDRCNFRCVYCLEPGASFMGSDELLSPLEFQRAARVCADLGVRKVRVTGGEPTVHPRLEEIIGLLAQDPRTELAMTTNGALVTAAKLEMWRRAGLHRLTISIDAAEPGRFEEITRSGMPVSRVLDAIEAAAASSLGPIKLNAVIIRGWNEDQIVPLAQLARRFGVEMRFIEFMPLDAGKRWSAGQVVTGGEIHRAIDREFGLVELGREDASSTAVRYRFADGGAGSVGIIAPVSQPFCGACSRLRITADGKVRPCLFSTTEWDLRPALRSGDDGVIQRFLVDAAWTKSAGHGISTDHFERPERSMSAIGG